MYLRDHLLSGSFGLVGVLVLAASSHAQQFEDVPITGLAVAEVLLLVPEGALGAKLVSGPLPLEVLWNGRGGSGLARVSLVSGEIELEFQASLSTAGNPIVHLGFQGAQFFVPDVGSPLTPVFFTLEEISSTRVVTARSENVIAADRYESQFLGGPLLFNTRVHQGIPTNHIASLIPLDSVAAFYDSSSDTHIEANYSFVSPESFTEVFRFRARALHPVDPSIVTVLFPGAMLLLVGVLIGVSFRVMRSHPREKTAS